jgi:hypothetical protein
LFKINRLRAKICAGAVVCEDRVELVGDITIGTLFENL